MADVQPLDAPALVTPVSGDPGDGLLVTGDHDRPRPVDRCDADPVRMTLQQWQDLLLGGLHRGHRAPGGESLHEAAPGDDHGTGVGQGQHARDMGGDEFADGVSEQSLGPYAPRVEQREQGHLDGEDRRLRELGAIQQRRFGRARLSEDDRTQRPRQTPVEFRADRVEGRAKGGKGLVQLPAHSRALAALPGEQERQPPRCRGLPTDQVGALLARDQSAEGGTGSGGVVGQHDRPVLEPAAAVCEGPGHSTGADVGPAGGPVEQPARLLPQGLGRAGRQQPGQGARIHPRGRGRDVPARGLRHDRGRFLHDQVGVGAADAEGRDADAARVCLGRPVPDAGEGQDCALGPVDLRGGLLGVQGGRQRPVPQRHHGLDDPGDTGCCLRVSDVGLDRADPQR